MTKTHSDIRQQVVESFELDALSRPVDIALLATTWGVTETEQRPIASEAMLLPNADGYKVILKSANTPGEMTRQRFSFAHELGHLLLHKAGYDRSGDLQGKHRKSRIKNQEERLCDQIAAEILMPRYAFIDDANKMGWSLHNLRELARLYDTSIPATAYRMVGLMDETCLMGIWKFADQYVKHHSLQQSFGTNSRYGVPNSDRLPRRRLWLIGRASNGWGVQSGIAPVVDKKRGQASPTDVPAEAWAWGKDEHRRVIVYYYPERKMTENMMALANATRHG
jgi:Zn-dependent peptidase ImmA (M78 family)